MKDKNPCFRCGFYDEDYYGCTADPYHPCTVPEGCSLYYKAVIEDMIKSYESKGEVEEND